jgi:hypothetical protein
MVLLSNMPCGEHLANVATKNEIHFKMIIMHEFTCAHPLLPRLPTRVVLLISKRVSLLMAKRVFLRIFYGRTTAQNVFADSSRERERERERESGAGEVYTIHGKRTPGYAK